MPTSSLVLISSRSSNSYGCELLGPYSESAFDKQVEIWALEEIRNDRKIIVSIFV